MITLKIDVADALMYGSFAAVAAVYATLPVWMGLVS